MSTEKLHTGPAIPEFETTAVETTANTALETTANTAVETTANTALETTANTARISRTVEGPDGTQARPDPPAPLDDSLTDDQPPDGDQAHSPGEPAPARATRPPTARPARARRRRSTARPAWLAPSVAALVLVAGAGSAVWAAVQLDAARQIKRQADTGLLIAADPAVQRATATVGSGSVNLLISGSRAAVVARDLPALDAQHAYQLWLVRSDTVTPVAIGPAGTAARRWLRLIAAVQPGDTIALSQEPAQGSSRPTGRPIAALKV